MPTLPFTVKTFNFKNLHFGLAWPFTFHCHHANILDQFFCHSMCFVISFSTINFESKTEEQFSYKKWSMYAPAIQLYDVSFGQFEHDFYCFDWYSWIWLVVFIKFQKSDKNQVVTYTERPGKKSAFDAHGLFWKTTFWTGIYIIFECTYMFRGLVRCPALEYSKFTIAIATLNLILSSWSSTSWIYTHTAAFY